jgi:hypothetical protein
VDALDGRVVVLLLWGGGTLGAYAQVFLNRWRGYRRHHDARSRRDLLEAAGLLLTAFGASAAIALLLFGPIGNGIRGVAVALALGGFLAVGIYMAQENPVDGK